MLEKGMSPVAGCGNVTGYRLLKCCPFLIDGGKGEAFIFRKYITKLTVVAYWGYERY